MRNHLLKAASQVRQHENFIDYNNTLLKSPYYCFVISYFLRAMKERRTFLITRVSTRRDSGPKHAKINIVFVAAAFSKRNHYTTVATVFVYSQIEGTTQS